MLANETKKHTQQNNCGQLPKSFFINKNIKQKQYQLKQIKRSIIDFLDDSSL